MSPEQPSPAVPNVRTFARADYNNDLQQTLGALLAEFAWGRVRQRALLEALREGPFDWATYERIVNETAARDYEAFVQQVLLTGEAFERHFGEWIAGERERFGRDR